MSATIRILVVEDNPADADLIREMLPESGSLSFRIESVQRLSVAIDRLKDKVTDLVLLDLSLPDSHGIQTFHLLIQAAPHIPVIVLTGTDDQELALTAVREGAQDFLVKGQFTGTLLARAARYAVERKRAEEDLQRKNAEMEQFIYAVSHDLKSPLVTIKTFLGYLENDLQTNQPGNVAKDFEYIHSAADKMGLMLQELLELARVGRTVERPEEVPLQEIVQEASALLAGQISKRGAEVVVTQEPLWIHGDRSRLVAIYQNLIDNAVKFLADQPSPRIEIGVDKSGNEPELFVRDNGKGIDPKHQSRIFGLFSKLDPGTTGSGIGLALVRSIIEVHGGKIRVQSDGLGYGTSFHFTLARTRLG